MKVKEKQKIVLEILIKKFPDAVLLKELPKLTKMNKGVISRDIISPLKKEKIIEVIEYAPLKDYIASYRKRNVNYKGHIVKISQDMKAMQKIAQINPSFLPQLIYNFPSTTIAKFMRNLFDIYVPARVVYLIKKLMIPPREYQEEIRDVDEDFILGFSATLFTELVNVSIEASVLETEEKLTILRKIEYILTKGPDDPEFEEIEAMDKAQYGEDGYTPKQRLGLQYLSLNFNEIKRVKLGKSVYDYRSFYGIMSTYYRKLLPELLLKKGLPVPPVLLRELTLRDMIPNYEYKRTIDKRLNKLAEELNPWIPNYDFMRTSNKKLRELAEELDQRLAELREESKKK